MKSTACLIWMLTCCGLFSSGGNIPKITYLNLGYKEVMRCNGIFAENNDQYYNKYWFFGRDTVGHYGLIRFEGHPEKTILPIKKSISKKRKRGQAWQETYANDSIQVKLAGYPIPQQIQNTFSYNVDFEMVMGEDTIRQKLIGHCRY